MMDERMTGGTTESGEARPIAPGEIVLAVSHDVRPTEESGPIPEYAMLGSMLGAVIEGRLPEAGFSAMRRFEDASALDMRQALHIARKYPNARAYVSFSERIGISLALLLKRRKDRPAHMMIAHRLNTSKKRALDRIAGWSHGVDRIVTLCTPQMEYARTYLPKGSVFIRQGADNEFYRPPEFEEGDYALAVGIESRDYDTLFAALAHTDIKLKVVASSPWSRRRGDIVGASGRIEVLPRVAHPTLRELYQRAKMVVVPLRDVDYAAGLNGVIEALCVNKPLIVSDSRGIRDYVAHMESAYVVPAGDANALTAALTAVDRTDALRDHLRQGAARTVREFNTLRGYARRLEYEVRVMLAVRESAQLPRRGM